MNDFLLFKRNDSIRKRKIKEIESNKDCQILKNWMDDGNCSKLLIFSLYEHKSKYSTDPPKRSNSFKPVAKKYG